MVLGAVAYGYRAAILLVRMGMLDTIANGALPDVAAIPPGLLPWAQSAWNNVFYTGGGVARLTALASAIKGRR
jgi:hypothetical protein